MRPTYVYAPITVIRLFAYGVLRTGDNSSMRVRLAEIVAVIHFICIAGYLPLPRAPAEMLAILSRLIQMA
jgi:hypothetical protein